MQVRGECVCTALDRARCPLQTEEQPFTRRLMKVRMIVKHANHPRLQVSLFLSAFRLFEDEASNSGSRFEQLQQIPTDFRLVAELRFRDEHELEPAVVDPSGRRILDGLGDGKATE